MKVTIHSILGLREVIGDRRVDMDIPEGSTVAGLLSYMIKTWEDRLKPYLVEEKGGHIHPYIRIMVNGRQIKNDEMESIRLKEGDEILFIPFAAGG